MRTTFRHLLTWAFCGLSFGFCGVAGAASFETYVNDRFGTSAEVPADAVAEPPPVNNDGRRFIAPDGGSVTIYAIRNKDRAGFQGYRDFLQSSLKSEGWEITYSAGEGDWFVFSGKRKDTILYHRAEQPAGCDRKIIHQIELRYPAANADAWQAAVERGAASLDGPCR